MNVSIRNFGIATLCLAAAAPSLAMAQPSMGLRIPVGDLAQPDAARDFNARLQAAATRFCTAHYRPVELAQLMTCERAVRDEGLSQLSWSQREAFAHAIGPDRQMASR